MKVESLKIIYNWRTIIWWIIVFVLIYFFNPDIQVPSIPGCSGYLPTGENGEMIEFNNCDKLFNLPTIIIISYLIALSGMITNIIFKKR